MRYIKSIRRRIRRFFATPQYPETVSLDITNPPVKFRVHSDTEAFRTIGFGGERGQIELYLSELLPDDVVYDIGASIGLMSLTSAIKCSNGNVVAFEPDSQILERLHINIKLNDLHNIITKPYVLNNENGKVALFSDGSDSVSPSLTGKNVMNLNLKSNSVDGYMIDTLIETEGLPVPDVLKIDVEGAEYNVIQGADRLLSGQFSRQPRFIFMEAHPEFLPDYGVTIEDLLDKIASYGYETIHQYDREAQQHYFMKIME